MKLYIVCLTTYFETDGIETELEIFETREEASEFLESKHNKIKDGYDEDDIDWDNFEDDTYSLCAYDEGGYFERYEAQIIEKEVR